MRLTMSRHAVENGLELLRDVRARGGQVRAYARGGRFTVAVTDATLYPGVFLPEHASRCDHGYTPTPLTYIGRGADLATAIAAIGL